MLANIANTIRGYCHGFFHDADGKPSSKRLVSLGSAGSLLTAFWINSIHPIHFDDNLVDAVKWLAGGGLLTTVAEKFAPKKDD